MKGSLLISPPASFVKFSLTLLLLVAFASGSYGQTPASGLDAEGIQRRVTRARALAAAGNLPAARSELEALQRTSGVDPSVREITLVLLAGIYIDQADYTYAENLLNAAFGARTTGGDGAMRGYFGLAGQVLGGVRARLERYRVFGLNVADEELPEEAAGDVERLRKLLEKVFAQGRQLRDENARNMDATALLEEAAGVRLRLARKDEERGQWQAEVTDARQRLMGANARAATSAAVAPLTPPPQPTTSSTNSSPPQLAAAQPSPPGDATQTASANTPASAGTRQGSAAPQPANSQAAASPQPGGNSNAAASDGQPVQVGSLLPIAAQKVAPSYPPSARAARISGKVTVFLMLDEKGAVAKVERTDGPQLLRGAAEEAARRWKFRPTLVNGQPVRVAGFINFNFAL